MSKKEWTIVQCGCGESLLVNLIDGSYESLGHGEEEEPTEELDTALPDGYQPLEVVIDDDHFDKKAPRLIGTDCVDSQGHVVKVHRPRTGLRTETQMGSNPHSRSADHKHGTHGNTPQPLGKLNPVLRPKNGQHSREGFEVEGDSPSSDFTGLTGQEAHFDNLMQQAYEADLQNYGFSDTNF